jgi:hypothetical protein
VSPSSVDHQACEHDGYCRPGPHGFPMHYEIVSDGAVQWAASGILGEIRFRVKISHWRERDRCGGRTGLGSTRSRAHAVKEQTK